MATAAAPAPRRRIPQQYIIEGILPVNQIHLLAGPSGGGKTTLAFQMMEAIAKGTDVLGHRCRQTKQAYVSCDRNMESVYATLDRMRLDIDELSIPMWTVIDHNISNNFQAIHAFVKQQAPETKLLIIDGFITLCPKGNITDYDTVASFLVSIVRTCRSGLTILGLCHDAKLRQGHEYIMERERVIGSAAWGGFSDTIIHTAPANPKDAVDNTRAIAILPRNSCNENLQYSISDGRLHPCNMSEESVDLFLLEQDIQRHPEPIMRAADILAFAASHNISRSKAYQYIEKLLELGKLERCTTGGREKGMYKRVTPQ